MITSTSNKQIKEFKKLKQKKYRDQYQQFMIETEHLIQEALKLNKLDYLITTDQTNIDFEPTLLVSDHVFESLSNQKSSSGMIGICSYLDSTLSNDSIIALDNVQDPGNVGTILRNALAFNYKNILIGKDCADIYNPKTIQASQGAIFQLNIEVVDLEDKLKSLKEDYTLISTSLDNAQALTKDTSIKDKYILILGNEGTGVKQEILAMSDVNYYIEINNIDSLNVASASAIMMYQLHK